jgi:DNA-binding transcriptional ArsR family regulator
MDVEGADETAAPVAAAIGEPARARMLYYLLDGRARTATELAVVADVTPSTASVHLRRLLEQRLVSLLAQGKHRYYSLNGAPVADALEALSVLAGRRRREAPPNASHPLRAARTCYDHIAGSLGVSLHDRIRALRWLSDPAPGGAGYEVTPQGRKAFEALGVDIDAAVSLRRRFAFGCLDWSERRHHLGGALGAALLSIALKRRWVTRDVDSRILSLTAPGRREMQMRFGLAIPPHS